MTLEFLRFVSSVFLVGTLITLSMTTFFMIQGSGALQTHDYVVDMYHRVGYVTALLEWLPYTNLTDQRFWTNVEKSTAFTVSFVDPNESHVRSIEVESVKPHTAYEYSESLGTVVRVEEQLPGYAQSGCPSATLAVSASFVFAIITLGMMVMRAANYTAFWQPQRRYLAYILNVIGFLTPIACGAAMAAGLLQLNLRCSKLAWQDDALRTAQLVGYLYSSLANMYPSEFTLALLSDTFEVMNNEFIDSGTFSMHIVQHNENQITPAVSSDYASDVRDVLLSNAVGQRYYSAYLPESKVIVSTYHLPVQQCLVAVARSVKQEVDVDRHGLWFYALILAVAPQCIFFIPGVLIFPWCSMGKLTGNEKWRSPWEWRCSEMWPLWKMFEGVALIVITILALAYYVERSAAFAKDSNKFELNVQERLLNNTQLANEGVPLLHSYVELLSGVGYNADYFSRLIAEEAQKREHLDGHTVHLFMNKVAEMMLRTQYTTASVIEKASLVSQSFLPLLSENHDVQANILTEGDKIKNSDELYLSASVKMWDVWMLFALVSSNSTLMRQGEARAYASILLFSEKVGGPALQEMLKRVVEVTLLRAEEYAAVADAFNAQNKNDRDVATLFESEEGQDVLLLEDHYLNALIADIPKPLPLDTYSIWVVNDVGVWLIVGIFVFGLLTITDYAYSAHYFGISYGPSYDPGENNGPPSSDYTAPRSFLRVNHPQLWRGVWGTSLSMCAVTFICTVAASIALISSLNMVNDILVKRSTAGKLSTTGITDAGTVGMASSVVSAWAKAYLDPRNETVMRAAELSNQWIAPLSENDVPTSPALLGTLSFMSSLVDTRWNNNGKPLYNDFLMLLPTLNEVGISLGLCLEPRAYLEFGTILADFLLDMLYYSPHRGYTVNATSAALEKLLADNAYCNVTSDTVVAHVSRVYTLRARASMYDVSRLRLSSILQQMEKDTREAVQSVEAEHASGDDKEVSIGAAPMIWIPIIAAWLCVPFVYVLYRDAQRILCSLYFY